MVESTTVETTDRLARAFKALGDPTRLRIVAVLADGERCVCEIQAHLEVPPNLLSHHLKVLRQAELIAGTRRGRWIDYRLRDDALEALRAALPPDPRALGLGPAVPVACDPAGPSA